jgi:4-hydroxy-3-polyprenylbenzoate decarboxylase
MKRIIVGISGASGAIFAQRILELLYERPDIEIHLVISEAARTTIAHELGLKADALEKLAHTHYDNAMIGAAPASGSFEAHGMIIAPCSMRTCSSIAYSMSDNLLIRAADVTLKERRPLVLMVRETPLHLGHLRTMTRACEIGAIIAPPVPPMYARPETLDEMITQSAARALDTLGVALTELQRWKGLDAPFGL